MPPIPAHLWSAVQRPRAVVLGVACLLAAALVGRVQAVGPEPDAPRRTIALVQSYARDAGPFNEVGFALEETMFGRRPRGQRRLLLKSDMDLTRHGLDSFNPQDSAASLRRKLGGAPVDLMIAVGDPAARLVAGCRDQVVPGVPVLLVGCDAKTTAASLSGSNTVILAQQLTVAPALSNILRLLPETTNIVVVAGTTEPEQLMLDQLSPEFMQFTNRVSFPRLSNLPLEEIKNYCAKLPPRSAIFYVSLAKDGSGAEYDYDFALRKLLPVVNAPVFSLFESQFGDRVVGGPLMPDTTLGTQAGIVAERLMNGERPEDISVPVSVPAAPVYDARELARWKIDERMLPPGSVVQFRPPPVWQRYRGQILVLAASLVAQGVFIVALLVHRQRLRKSQADLQKRIEHESLAVRAANLGFWNRDIGTGAILGSPEYRKLFGFSAEEPLSIERVSKVVHPEDQAARSRAMQVAIESCSEYASEFRIVKPDGAMRWIVSRGIAVADGDGKAVRVAGVAMDITESKQREEALRSSEARIASAIEIAGMGFYENTANGRVLFVDARLRNMLGLPAEQEVDIREFWLAGIHPEDRPEIAAASQRILAGDVDRISASYRYVHPSGQQHWFQHLSRILERDDAGRMSRGIGVILDITERRNAEEEVRRLSHAVEHSPVSVVITDLRGSIVYVNRKFCEVSGYSVGESIGNNPRILKSGETGPELYRELWACIAGGGTWRGEFHNRKKNGEFYWESSVISPLLDGAGKVTHYIGLKEDITERKIAEMETAELRNELTHVTRVAAVGELAASLAHELNQPLAAIIANTDAAEILAGRPEPDLTEIQSILDDIRRDGMRAGETIHRMRAFLQRRENEVQPVDVEDLVRESVKFVSMDAAVRKITLEFRCEPDMRMGLGDRIQLQQVLLNLIVNGMDAMSDMPEGARRLTVNARQVSTGLIEISVTDRGHGILPDQLAQVFEPFFTTKRSGLGMGLAISRTIVEAHGGRLGLENNPSGGATARFTIPIAVKEARR